MPGGRRAPGLRLERSAGRDLYVAGPGKDMIRSRDGLREVVNCGVGRHTAVADRRDVVIGCEHVLCGWAWLAMPAAVT